MRLPRALCRKLWLALVERWLRIKRNDRCRLVLHFAGQGLAAIATSIIASALALGIGIGAFFVFAALGLRTVN